MQLTTECNIDDDCSTSLNFLNEVATKGGQLSDYCKSVSNEHCNNDVQPAIDCVLQYCIPISCV